MAIHALSGRQMYPSLGHYQPSHSSPVTGHAQQHDYQPRNYAQTFNMPQSMYAYSQYSMPPHSGYMQQPISAQAYPPVSAASQAMLLGHQTSPQLMQQHSTHAQIPVTTATAGVKRESIAMDSQHSMLGSMTPMSAHSATASNNTQSASRADPATAAPGPIPATTPLVVRQDQNGVQWIAFEYSRDRIKSEYTIRCDVESVDTTTLSEEFKTQNCVYPRACRTDEPYKGNRLHYESECNTVGWALAELNPNLRDKRGLIQRAVDSWRNSNQNPRLRSRRVRRQAKLTQRKAQSQDNNPTPAVQTSTTSLPIGLGIQTHQLNSAAGQLHHQQHSGYHGTGAHGDEVGLFHQM